MNAQALVDIYTSWLRDQISCQQIGEYCEMTLPYLDSINDYIQIYARQYGDDILFTDGGATISALEVEGFWLEPNRMPALKSLLKRYGVQLDGNALTIRVPTNNFAPRLHMLIQVILKTCERRFT